MIQALFRPRSVPLAVCLVGFVAMCPLGGCQAAYYCTSPASKSPLLQEESRGFASVGMTAAGRVEASPTPSRSSGPSGFFKLASITTDGERSGDTAPTPTPGGRRIVIYNAGYKSVVKDIEASLKAAEAIAAELDGWVQEIRGESITIRVPVANYAEAVSRTEKLGRIAHREQEAADVTEEYVDLEARLKNAKAVRARLETLLEKAADVKAALAVETELNRVGEEIERLEGKLKLLKDRVAYSTITVTFERVYRAAPTPQMMRLPFHWLTQLNPNRLSQRS